MPFKIIPWEKPPMPSKTTPPDLGELIGRFADGYERLAIHEGPPACAVGQRCLIGQWNLYLTFNLKLDNLSAKSAAELADLHMREAVWDSRRTRHLMRGFAVSVPELTTFAATRPRQEREVLLSLVGAITSGAFMRTVLTTRTKAAARKEAAEANARNHLKPRLGLKRPVGRPPKPQNENQLELPLPPAPDTPET